MVEAIFLLKTHSLHSQSLQKAIPTATDPVVFVSKNQGLISSTDEILVYAKSAHAKARSARSLAVSSTNNPTKNPNFPRAGKEYNTA